MTRLELAPYGDGAALASITHVPVAARAGLLRYLRGLPGVTDATLTEDHALVLAAAGSFARVHDVELDASAPGEAGEAREHALRLRWDGPDLEAASRLLAQPRGALIAACMAPTYTVSFLGFRPGFAYLRGVPEGFRLPRRDTVRARVEANTFALGGPYAGVYPCPSPGGFWLLGTVLDVTLFEREGPRAGPLLRAGDHVRFVEAR